MLKFNKKVSIMLAVLLVFVQFLGVQFNLGDLEIGGNIVAEAAEPYSWNNAVPEKTPSITNDNGKLVLFDNSHGSTTGSADWVMDGAFSDFADALVTEGYTVREYRGVDKNGDGVIRYYDDRQASNVEINEALITYDGIKDADVFVMAEPNRPFTQSEYAALKQFVDAGKGIYFISDHYNADRNKNTWDSTEVFNGYNRSTDASYNMGGIYGDQRNPGDAYTGWLAENFGIRFRFNALDYKSGVSDVRPASETEGITEGVQPILMAAGSTLAITDGTKAKGLVYFAETDTPAKWSYAVDSGIYFGGEDEGPYVAISKPSAGKAAFIGDSSPIEDASPKYLREETGSSKSTYPGWTDPGNAAILSVNIVNWLSTPESYVGFDGVNHTQGIPTPTPMTNVETYAPQAEPWATPSYNPWDTDTFATGSYGAPYGTTDGGGGTTPTGDVQLALYPSYVYYNEAYAVVVGGTATDPEFGAYTSSGLQVGQLYTNGSWTASGYNVISGAAPVAATARVVSTESALTLKARTGTSYDKQGVTCVSSNYGYLQGAVSGQQGEIVAVIDNGIIIGTAQIDSSGEVTIAANAGTGYTLELYGTDGNKKSDFTGTYDVISGQTTQIDGSGGSTGDVSVTGVSINSTSINLSVGQTSTLTATVEPVDATNQDVTWSSSNTNVATVNQSGLVTAISAGTATVTVTTVDGGYIANCTVNVTDVVNGTVFINLAPDYVYYNEPYAVAIGGNANNPEFGAYTSTGLQVGQLYTNGSWTSSGYNVISGITPVAATARVVSTQSTLTLKARTSSSYEKHSVTCISSNYGYIQGSVSGQEGQIVTVTDNGTIIGTAQIDANGEVNIAANAGTGYTLALYGVDGVKISDLTGTYSVASGQTTQIDGSGGSTGDVLVTGVSLGSTSLNLNAGQTSTLTATVEPFDATNQDVTWSSSNTNVATVNQSGLVTAIAAGTATITVTTVDGGYIASCTVNVTDVPAGTVFINLAPDYVYYYEPFAVAVGGNAINPEFGAYTSVGLQIGQLYINGLWTSSGYNDIPGTTPVAATARVVSTQSSLTLKARTSSDYDRHSVTCITSDYGYLQGTVNGQEGQIVAVLDNGTIIGTAQIDSNGEVIIAAKSGTGYTLALYGVAGNKIRDLSGTYSVTSGQTTQISDM